MWPVQGDSGQSSAVSGRECGTLTTHTHPSIHSFIHSPPPAQELGTQPYPVIHQKVILERKEAPDSGQGFQQRKAQGGEEIGNNQLSFFICARGKSRTVQCLQKDPHPVLCCSASPINPSPKPQKNEAVSAPRISHTHKIPVSTMCKYKEYATAHPATYSPQQPHQLLPLFHVTRLFKMCLLSTYYVSGALQSTTDLPFPINLQ